MQKLIASACESVKSTSRPAGFGRNEETFPKSTTQLFDEGCMIAIGNHWCFLFSPHNLFAHFLL
jgi:hypothetical protein